MRQSIVLPRGSCAAACRWAPQRIAATAPSAAAVSGPKHQLMGPTSTICKPFRSVPARCSGGSSGGGPAGERGQPPPAPAGAANIDVGSSAAEQLAEGPSPQSKAAQQQQEAAEEGRPLLQEAIRLLQEAQEDMCDVPERNEAVKQKQSAAIKMLLELQQQVQHGAGQSVSGDTESAATEPHEHTTWRIWPQVLDYVSVRPHAKQGVVLGTAREGRAFKVWSLPGSTGVREACTARLMDMSMIAESELEPGSGRVKYLPYDPKRQGVPVTRFTAAPGMLVRRMDGVDDTCSAAVPGEVGVIQPHVELFGEDSCVVEWGNSRTAVYGIGFDDGFELVHLETSPTSGAPVVGKFWTGVEEGTCDREELLWEGRELERPDGLVLPVNLCGMPVERGTHWTYSEAEPGVGVIQDAGAAGQEEGAHVPAGFSLPVQWPNGQLMHHRACPAHGYDLCYSAQAGESVTLFTAREGLRVRMYGGGEEGVLVQPMEVSPASGGGVVWLVDFSGGDRDGMKLTFLVTRHYAEPTWHATQEYEDASELEYI